MKDKFGETVKGIKELRIQGARTIAKRAVQAMIALTNRPDFNKIRDKAIDQLIATRPTEPMMRNYLNSLRGLDKQAFKKEAKALLEKMQKDVEKIILYGSSLIEGNIVMLCHSSTAVAIVKEAAKKKNISVVVGETRPRYQGRITYKELEEAGVDVSLVVDNSLHRFLRKADAVLVGADAIDATGALYNKIGTYTLAVLADKYEVPFYSSAETAKYDSDTAYGHKEVIEQRDPKEVWNKKAKIYNYAFDLVPAKYITSYITEFGLIAPQLISTIARW